MEALLHDWLPLAAIALLLGVRHGLDADHLVAIDGIARCNASDAPRLARRCGLLFSLGHGAVVVTACVAASLAATRWQPPAWIEHAGAWISIGFLLAIGVANLDAVLRTPRHEIVRPAGIKARWLARLQRARNPWLIVAIGALFALSLDTLSQAALFAAAAASRGSLAAGVALAACFVGGMIVADGLNGAWIAWLARRADRSARVASRAFGTTIALLSLALAAVGVVRLALPGALASLDSDASRLALGVATIAVVALGFVLAMRGSREPARA